MAEIPFADYPNIGHYSLSLVDQLQLLVEKNDRVVLFPNWLIATDFCNMDESFVTITFHLEELGDALNAHVSKISTKVKEAL